MKAISYTCFKLEEETTRSVNKNNFINIVGDTFVVSIRWEKSTISFYKKVSSCIDFQLYLQLLMQVTELVTEG